MKRQHCDIVAENACRAGCILAQWRAMLNREDIHRLAAATGCDPRTVQRWGAGGEVLESNRIALESAAGRLGIMVPECADKQGAAS